MQRKKQANKSLSEQMEAHVGKESTPEKEYEGNANFISTGSTLLDLAISGGRVRGGGIPGGIMVEIFGPSGSGKTVLLCELGGYVQRAGGDTQFHDPEARINTQFAAMFGIEINEDNYYTPDTVPELFEAVRKWEPKGDAKVNGIFADSLAALSTKLEMGTDGDKMGMRRAKEFSQECRTTCRILTKKGLLMVCSNQIRENMDAGHGPKYKSPGGQAIGFYSSLRLRVHPPEKIKKEKKFKFDKDKKGSGVEVSRITGTKVQVSVFKNSVWKPYRTAPVYITHDYGIDDIRANLQFIKEHMQVTSYILGDQRLGASIDKAISVIEGADLEDELREAVIDLWEEIEAKFKQERKPKKR